LRTSRPSGKTKGELPAKVSRSEKPASMAAARVKGFIVEPTMPPETAQLIWLSR